MSKFTWGDSARIRGESPTEMRPGAYVAVCAISEADTAERAAEFGCSIGDVVYLVEFSDGSSIEVAERYLEPYSELDG